MNTKKAAPEAKAVAAPATVLAPDSEPVRRHWRRMALFIILWFTVLLYAAVIAKALPAKAKRDDFSPLYTSASILRQGGNPYYADLRRTAEHFGLTVGKIEHPGDPPTFLLCFELMTLLRPWPAFWVWTGLNIAALGASLVLLFRREQGLIAYTIWIIVGLVMLYPPIGDHLLWANHKLILLLILVMMLRWLEHADEGAAGSSLALAGLLRVFPLLLGLYLVLIGRWRAVVWCLAALSVGGIVTLAVVGFENCQGFLLALIYFSGREWTTLPSNISVTATVSRIVFCLHPHVTPRFVFASWALGFTAHSSSWDSVLRRHWLPYRTGVELAASSQCGY